MYGNEWLHGMPMMGWGAWIVMILFWILVFYGLAMLVSRRSPDKDRPGPVDKKPLDIVKERYARGEIRREEYEQMKRDLDIPST